MSEDSYDSNKTHRRLKTAQDEPGKLCPKVQEDRWSCPELQVSVEIPINHPELILSPPREGFAPNAVLPTDPVLFLKPISSLITEGQTIKVHYIRMETVFQFEKSP